MSEFDTLANEADTEVITVMGDTAVYKRGNDPVTPALTVVALDANRETVDDDDVIRYQGEVDFLVRAADIIILSALTRPLRNDVITWKGNNYEVTDPAYEPDDPAEIMLRVHTKLIGD